MKLSIRAYKTEGADPKKSLSLKSILKQNPWLRHRVIVGSNYRADVLFLRSLNRFKSRYSLWKALGSSQETAYRICKELDRAPELNLAIGWS